VNWCLTPGIADTTGGRRLGVRHLGVLRRDVDSTAAVAAEEIFYSNVFGVAGVRYPTAGPHCNAGRLEVKTFDSSPALTNQIGFTVIVP
jgi:hypothetical protein